ncbi:6467_t:CDS:2, partial [Acaulospora colombiana]
MQRLKPAHEIYKRLKWDEEVIPGGDFIIGYEDRFLGIMEATGRDFEEDEIPFHRIRYFKIASTGQIVWDREKRVDLITRNYAGPSSSQNDSYSSEEESSGFQESPELTTSKSPIFSVKSKKDYLKRKRRKSLQKSINEAREQLEEEKRIEEEHLQQHEDKMREVEERIERFQELQ